MKLKVILFTGGLFLTGWLAASFATADAPKPQFAQEEFGK